jgi:3-oxoacyl-[acyl-carrier-protein] synthase III
MDKIENVGILSLGVYLPPEIRRNDWWPESTVAKWREKLAQNLARPQSADDTFLTEGIRRTLGGMSEFGDDPFKGAQERRVMPEGMDSSEMETFAGRDAIERSGISPDQIGLLLVYSQLPDYLTVPTAPRVHHNLGLPADCITLSTDTACNSFLMQYSFGEQMIKGGKARYALIIQSSSILRACRPEDHFNVWFGDGATAAVIGPVARGRGLVSESHRTDGSYYRALVTGCPGKRWYNGDQPPFVHTEDTAAARKMLLSICDMGKEVLQDAIAKAGLKPEDIDFYATHQSTHWFRKVTQDYIGLSNAKTFDSFTWTGSLAASNVPFMMAMGEREGLLEDDDLVAMFSGGGGLTYSGIVLRWGR